MENNDLLVLNELTDSGSNLRPSIQVEHALTEIKDTYLTSPLAKIPFTEIAALGGSFASVAETMATPAAEGIYRCVFPKGVTGTLAMAKDGSGALGTIMNDGIVGQARWIPVDKAIGPACLKAALVAVDEFLIGIGDSISDAEKKQLEKTMAFFIQYKDSGLTPIAEHIATINHLSNKPVVMLYDKKVLCFHELSEAE